MKIYFITGISAAGKSEVCEELVGRGYIAYDGDSNHITNWVEKKTGKSVKSAERVAGPNGSLIEQYDWRMSKQRIHELAAQAKSDTMFICGTASNRYELWGVFEKVFCLIIDKDTLVQRISTRTNNKFGKDPKDLHDVLGWHKNSERTDIEAGAIPIDATEPVAHVVDEILGHIAPTQPS